MGRRVLSVAITVVAVAASVLSSFYVFGAHDYVSGDDRLHLSWLSVLSFLAALDAAALLCWRHRWPVVVTGVAAVPPLLLAADSLAALIALAALAAHRRDRVLWAGGAIVYAATALAVWRDAHRNPEVTVAGRIVGTQTSAGQVIGILLMAAIMTAIPIIVGTVRGVRGELARREASERELRAEMTRREERTRIAREMHDVLGHRLSLLSLQAGALEVSRGAGSAQATEVARTVRTTARQSLEDLRQVIGVLRDGQGFAEPDGDPRGPVRPQPTLSDIPELIANARRSGLAVNVTILIDEAAAAPAPLGTAAYRVLQESLTNVLRHAPGAAAEVFVRGGPGVGLALEVVNPLGAGAAEPSPGSGTGLTGIGERVALLGGNVSAGPTDERMFALRAWLPWARH
ncbi:sensor histidine kinase [Amycolatopsis anabasis]|uniref:sensor histidine kinase n=1 Tax=Amycolatopsis anabasis TaxID=1840409 RepID=UPI0015D3E642|nr:histidine kinase [Amycolatopsis anabasis]